MHLLEDEEEEGGGASAVLKVKDGGEMTNGVTSLDVAIRKVNKGVTNGDLPETPPSDVDEEMKEESTESIITNGKTTSDSSAHQSISRNSDHTADTNETVADIGDKEEEMEVNAEKKSKGESSGDDASNSDTQKDLTEEILEPSSSPKDDSPAAKPDESKANEIPTEDKPNDSTPPRQDSIQETSEDNVDKSEEKVEDVTKDKDLTKKSSKAKDSIEKPSDNSSGADSNEAEKVIESNKEKEKHADRKGDEKDKAPSSPSDSIEMVDTRAASPNTSIEILDEVEEELDEENMLDPTDGTLKVGGKIVELAPPPSLQKEMPKESDQLNDLMANNMEITICKAPAAVGPRRSSSSSNGSGKGADSGSDVSGSVVGKTALSATPSGEERTSVSPALSAEARKSVLEAELMLASVSEGEITITKSADGKPSAGETGSKSSELRMMRRSDLKRSLSSEVSSGGVDEMETNKKSRSEEDMVTEEYEPDLVESLEDEDEREKLVREYVKQASSSLSEVGENSAKLKREIHVLSELAQAKELEWNSILRLKKLKEEMWERLSRKIRVDSLFTGKRRPSSSISPPSSSKIAKPSPSSSPSSASKNNSQQRLILPKPTSQIVQQQPPQANPAPPVPNTEIVLAEGRQGRFKDVQAIINDYRAKNPNENSPHHNSSKLRSRRSSLNNANPASRYAGNPALLSMANLALGGGGQILTGARNSGSAQQQMQAVQQQLQNANVPLDVQLNYLGNVQGQRHSQNKPQSMPLPPVAQATFPEVTLHPVLPTPTQQQNSLLHGILTKANQSGKHQSQQQQQQTQQALAQAQQALAQATSSHPRSTSFSPTLARLLTAPERQQRHAAQGHVAASQAGANFVNALSASQNLSAMLRAQKRGQQQNSGPPCSNDIVNSLKHKIVPQQQHRQQQQQSEITITPVSALQMNKKDENLVNLDDEDENDRLVIDEGRSSEPTTTQANNSQPSGGQPSGAPSGEQIPECQGCHRNSAQFVCAGCGNQWYCSRECQVAAWEDHSDVCSG